MENKPTRQSIANIVRQQPLNSAEIEEQPSKQQTSLDRRIQEIQATASRTKKSIQTLFKSTKSTSIIQQPMNQNSECLASSHTTNNVNLMPTLPIVQVPEKSTLPFMERFQAHHANHQKPEYTDEQIF